MSQVHFELADALKDRYGYKNLPKDFKYDFAGLDVGWLRIYLGSDRHFFLRERQAIKELVNSFGLLADFETSWVWENAYNAEFDITIRQPTDVYVLFVSSASKKWKSDHDLIRISDTTDILYDYDLRELLDTVSLKFHLDPFDVNGIIRNTDGFILNFYQLRHAKTFEKSTILGRKTSWSKTDRGEYSEYVCQLYMKDKEPESTVSLDELIKQKKRLPKVPKVKGIKPEELYSKVQTGEITLEEFTKIIGK